MAADDAEKKPVDARLVTEVLGYLYVYFLVKRSNVRHWFERRALQILLGAVLLAIAEAVLHFIGKDMVGPEQSAVLKILFLLTLLFVLYMKLREATDNRQQFYFVEAANQIVGILGQQRPAPSDDVLSMLAIFHRTFEGRVSGVWPWRKKNRPPDVSVALIQGKHPDEHLEIGYVFPADVQRDPAFRLRMGDGAAGRCCKHYEIVYVPRCRLRHAIIQSISEHPRFDMIAGLYHLFPLGQEYGSVLSVPVVDGGKCYGVLNFAARKPNAFRRLDFLQAVFYGFALARVLQGLGLENHRADVASATGA